jgi:hypothetical protein
MFEGLEQGSNDYQRLEGRWPASTGWLIVSIFFANKLWIGDVTSMSLYWVARLPIERPRKGESSPLAPALLRRPERVVTAVRPIRRSRQWKIAFSLAIVGALAAPFVLGTYNARPSYSVWVPLTARERENLAVSLQNSDKYCQRTKSIMDAVNCYGDKVKKEELELGGYYEYYPDWFKYLKM